VAGLARVVPELEATLEPISVVASPTVAHVKCLVVR